MAARLHIETPWSARPQITADLMVHTGLDEATLVHLVHGFYDRVRAETLLGPVFVERITDLPAHLSKMVAFWSSVALMTGLYHGSPMPKHLPLPVEQAHFDRWLLLFRQTAEEVCTPDGAIWLIERVHADHPKAPLGLSDLLQRLIGTLEVHIKKEELIFFPAIRRGGGPGIENPIAVMSADHDNHESEVARFCALTRYLTHPEGACRSWTALDEGFATFLADLDAHIRLENDVLFPRFEPAAQ